MSQRSSGLYRLLGVPAVYSIIQKLVGGSDGRAILVKDFIQPRAGDRILDIGCGPATMLPFLGDISYTGIDLSEAYIKQAEAKFGSRGTFLASSVDELAGRLDDGYDIVLAIALLHHLTDEQATKMFKSASSCLKPLGRLIALDCAWTSPQNPIAKLLIGLDRGKNVRTPEAYQALARQSFSSVKAVVRTDLNRFPYTHCIMTCQN
jgi:cyclopropane fatty-acyl-phospholipid synthase-like methyltransferase